MTLAKEPESPGSDLTELKTLFKVAHSKPVNAAFGLGADGKAVVKLDKMMKPEALSKLLLAAKIKPVYFGTVEIDSADAALAKFTMNKAPGGLDNKLIVALKGSGVSKVSIDVEGNAAPAAGPADADGDSDQDASQAMGDAPPPPADTAAPDPVSAAAAAPAAPPPSDVPAAAPSPAAPADSGPDAGALTVQLTSLAKQMMTAIAGNPALKTTLAPLATAAQASLKQGNLQQAAASIASLQQALSGAAAPGGASPPASGAAPAAAGDPPPADAAAVAPADTPAGKAHLKAGMAWKATHAKMSGDLDQLTSKFTDAFKEHPQAVDLQKAFKAKIDGVLGTLDHSLSAKLDELQGAKDGAAHAKIVTEAKAILAKYQQTVSSDPTIAAIDKNPFAPIGLQKTLNATLSTLAKVIV